MMSENLRQTMTPHLPNHLPVAMLAAAFLVGCGGTDYPKTVEVTGMVTLDGEPVPNAIVTFMPADGRRAATGYTDNDGQFTLTTYQDGDGAVPGTHNIAINPKEPPPMPGDVAVMGGARPESSQNYTPPFPVKYGRPKESGFTAEVTVEGENNFPLKMESSG